MDELSEFDKKWLCEWKETDMAMSPMDDKLRRVLRHGHYLGYIAAMKDDISIWGKN